MRDALQTLLRTCDRAALVGSDCAVLEPHHLAALCAALDRARMAFIPAEDGGYVAVAAREVADAAFGALDWGTDRVMQQTRAALADAGWRPGSDWCELPALWDIDRPDDLERAGRERLPVVSGA